MRACGCDLIPLNSLRFSVFSSINKRTKNLRNMLTVLS